MFEIKDQLYKKLALHGGGSSAMGHHVSFLLNIDFTNNIKSIPVITSSAGSIAVFILLACHLHTDLCAYTLMQHINTLTSSRMTAEFILDRLDETHLISSDEMFNTLSSIVPLDFMTLTFGDLIDRFPGLEWIINVTYKSGQSFCNHTFGTHTPEVQLWKACLASSAVPILVSPVEINGTMYFDGDLCDWAVYCTEADVLHVECLPNTYLLSQTGVAFVDATFHFFSCCIQNLLAKTHGKSRYILEFEASLFANPKPDEFLESGKKMASEFVLK